MAIINLAEVRAHFDSYMQCLRELASRVRTEQLDTTVRDTVKRAEEMPEFDALCRSLGKDSVIRFFTGLEAHNFFARSGAYLSIFEDKAFDVDALWNDFQVYVIRHDREGQPIPRYLLPIHSVNFGFQKLDLRWFSIRTFSVDELSILLEERTRNLLFGRSVAKEIAELSNYWFIEVVEKIRPVNFARDWDYKVTLARKDFPNRLQRAIAVFALWDWEGSATDRPVSPADKYKIPRNGWYRPEFLSLIALHGRRDEEPEVLPEIRGIPEVEDYDEYGNEVGLRLAYESEIADQDLFEQTTARFAEIVAKIDLTLEWQFMGTALGFFMRAFSADGLEQLIWHIVTIDSLLGGRRVSKEKIALRLQACLGYETEFIELYDLRSKLVHGSHELPSTEIWEGHLREARKLARLAIIWFLECLEHLDARGIRPSREDVLSALDIVRPSGGAVKKLINALPDDFPTVEKWSGHYCSH